MSSDESRGNYINPNRKSSPKNHGYSPSSNYNFGYGNNPQYNGMQQSSHHHHNNNSRKRSGFKGNSNRDDRLIKQNDTIIRLLKEIRDRLPPPVIEEKNMVGQAEEEKTGNSKPIDNENSDDNFEIVVESESNEQPD